ncbi:MAG: hypothetical protein K6F61_04130 [Clostridiales bacterium]|nr:hypothetical protein [Clostridiales bacterium]
MHRWCVAFEEIDSYGNQGIGTDVISASSVDSALKQINQDLEATFAANKDQITCWRVIGINIVPDLQLEVKP